MPFTPYHFGPGLLLGMILLPITNVTILLVASVILDIEPIVILLFNLNLPLHYVFHSYLGATIVAVLLALVAWPFRNLIDSIQKAFNINQTITMSRFLLSALIGTYSHVFLDSFLYPEMNPFLPIIGNPFVGLYPLLWIYRICVYSGAAGILLFIIHIARHSNKDQNW